MIILSLLLKKNRGTFQEIEMLGNIYKYLNSIQISTYFLQSFIPQNIHWGKYKICELREKSFIKSFFK